MTPLDAASDAETLDLDVPVDVSVRRTRRDPPPEAVPDTYLLRFVPDVTPESAEAVLGALTPPDEGIVVAGNGAVVVTAGAPFVEHAEAHPAVELVNAVRVPRREPTRVQVPARRD